MSNDKMIKNKKTKKEDKKSKQINVVKKIVKQRAPKS